MNSEPNSVGIKEQLHVGSGGFTASVWQRCETTGCISVPVCGFLFQQGTNIKWTCSLLAERQHEFLSPSACLSWLYLSPALCLPADIQCMIGHLILNLSDLNFGRAAPCHGLHLEREHNEGQRHKTFTLTYWKGLWQNYFCSSFWETA